ncbi:hypothetical protein AX769_01205 [Frondihabitans sp. PAMC 28766]|uniref:putative quinol monooxygenase n=1 Tax=Frondihabitans sp. PAMC 28766 TaxID=1795630 RepID=UPI00078D63E6|nr:putative quinol monooxygenase [Frondihabitans sp. PAMC 28766]AMM19011.1 hypothetical protein AX769_01205 [Frondihabitans sp. PAMC 28766]
MGYVVNATWISKPGSEEAVEAALGQIVKAAEAEAGNRVYQAYRDRAAPLVFHIFEVYDDEAAFDAHVKGDAFRHFGQEVVADLLESRGRETFETVDF